jgi:hypothetical protein
MAFLKQADILKLEKKLSSFLKNKWKGKVTRNKKIFSGFAPLFHVKTGKTERIVLFRDPPTIPDFNLKEIKLALKKGMGVYIAIYNHAYEKMLEDFLSKCEHCGIGVIQYEIDKSGFSVVLPSVTDYPKQDKIDESLIKIFISSKLWIAERKAAHKKVKSLRHQPICVERLSNQGRIETVCYNRIDESPYFIGILTPHYRELVDKEIKHALKKKPDKSLILIRNDCFIKPTRKLSKLIDYIKPQKTFYKFSSWLYKTIISNQYQ